MSRSCRGLTLLELLVAIGIIGMLAALLLPAVSQIRSRGQEVAARNLMQRLAEAIVLYLDRHPRLGADEDGDEFSARPWYFLHAAPIASGDLPYLELPGAQLEGEAIRDPRSGGASTLVWEVENRRRTPQSAAYTWRVAIRSTAGSIDPTDHLCYELITHPDPSRPEAVPGSWTWR